LRSSDVIKVGNVSLQVAAIQPDPRTAQAKPPLAPTIKVSGTFVKLQATTRRSWEQAVKQLGRPEVPNDSPVRRILPLLHAGQYLTQMSCVDDLLQMLLGKVVTALEAQRGAIVLADDMSGALHLRTAVAAHDNISLAKCYSRTLAERCFLQGESFLCEDVSAQADLHDVKSISQGTMASIICVLLRSPQHRLGVLHIDRGPFQERFSTADFDLVDALACYVSVGIESAKLMQQQRDLFLQAATALAQTVELRDSYTGGHTQRVAAYSMLLAEELRVTPMERHQIRIATPLHDIGKIAVADQVLRKPGKLTTDEFDMMKQHVLKGAELVGNIPGLTPMLPIVRSHHERWDGRGYPDGLAGDDIARVARIVTVADAYDAMTSNRPYRPAMLVTDAYAELCSQAGSHFDPRCVEAFLRLRPCLQKILAQGPAEGTIPIPQLLVQQLRHAEYAEPVLES
jgi:HD-GYP domain-containing protein (c-di-GMP phosphodiesterase class II)